MEKISQEEIVRESDFQTGKIVLLASRPGIGKSKTCRAIAEKYEGRYSILYFDCNRTAFSKEKAKESFIVDDTTHYCEAFYKVIAWFFKSNLKSRLVIIDGWEAVKDPDKGFLSLLYRLCANYGAVCIITAQLSRRTERHPFPSQREMNRKLPLSKAKMRKVALICQNLCEEDKISEYYEY